jgi:hypothetical protein
MAKGTDVFFPKFAPTPNVPLANFRKLPKFDAKGQDSGHAAADEA